MAGSPRELQIEACWEHSPAPPRKCPLSSPTGSPSEESAGSQPVGQPGCQRASQPAAAAAQGRTRRGARLGRALSPSLSPRPPHAGRSVAAVGLALRLRMGLVGTRVTAVGWGVCLAAVAERRGAVVPWRLNRCPPPLGLRVPWRMGCPQAPKARTELPPGSVARRGEEEAKTPGKR